MVTKEMPVWSLNQQINNRMEREKRLSIDNLFFYKKRIDTDAADLTGSVTEDAHAHRKSR